MKKIILSVITVFLLSTYLSTASAALTKQPSGNIQEYVESINHVCLIVSDMQKILNFYQGLLGFKILYDKTEKNPDMSLHNVVLMGPDHFKLELVQFYHPHGIRLKSHSIYMIAYNHIGIKVKDVNAVYKILTQHKIGIYSKPIVVKELGYSYFFAKDPDGNYIEFFQRLDFTSQGIMEM